MEVRRSIPPSGLSLWQRFSQAGGIVSLLLVLALLVGVVVMDVCPLDPLPWRAGQYVPSDVHVRAEFRILRQDRLADAQRKASELTPACFCLDVGLLDRIVGELKKMPDRLKATTRPVDLDGKLRTLLGMEGEDASVALAAWQAYAAKEKREKLNEQIELLREDMIDAYIVDPDRLDEQWHRTLILRVSGQYDEPTNPEKLIQAKPGKQIERQARLLAGRFDLPLRQSIFSYLSAVLSREPIYVYDPKGTAHDAERAMKAIADNPSDECYDVYCVGDCLVRRGGGSGVTGDELDLLRREHQAYLLSKGLDRPWSVVARVSARLVALTFLTLLMCFYIAFYQGRIVKNHLRGLAVVGTMLLMLAINKFLVYGLGLNPHVSVLPVLTATVILSIAYNQRFALGLGAIMAAFAVFQLRADFDMFTLLMLAVVASVFQLDEIRTRSKLIRVLGISAGLVFAASWCHGLFAAVPARFVLIDSLWMALSMLLVGILVQGMLPLIERAFRIVTSMTLLEWCDAGKPLMRRLAMEAPGTYNHSLQLGSMCETAAEVIGARGLLARVGAYYHDIGKIHKSDYFVENQAGVDSRHDKLSPEMSLLVIIGHVKDGIELAREYSLPPVLHEFIATHHGTTLVQYFFLAATEQRKDGTDRVPDETEFRYPGPKPHSREAAILMLADAAESSVRAMSEPTSARIENQVHTMVSRRLMDGQLDDCDLTLKEVHQIEASLVKSLCGVYHARIAYPTPPGETPSASEMYPKQNGERQ